MLFHVNRLRRLAQIICSTSFGIFVLSTVNISPVFANPLLLVDAATGEILFERDATQPWYPASLAKLMTAYVAFREARAGHIAFDTLIPITHRALSVETTRSGAEWGQSVTLDAALKFMLVQSANDMAITIAEGVGGTVENFVSLMNETARHIGMQETRFTNPNGLFSPNQQTSARDLALLVQRILTEFPDQHTYFAIGGIETRAGFRGNTNGLIGRYPGADGMKTGFICPSGFNLVATAMRNNRRLIAVVLGAESGFMRTARSARLLDYGFADAKGSGKFMADLGPVNLAAPPDLRAKSCNGEEPKHDLSDMPEPSIVTKLGERKIAAALPVSFGSNARSAYAPQARNFGMPDLPNAKPLFAMTSRNKMRRENIFAVTASHQPQRNSKRKTAFGAESSVLTEGFKINVFGYSLE